MELHAFAFNPFQENTYIVADVSGLCFILDPGMVDEEEDEELFSFIDKKGYRPVMIINTHCHLDHILGNRSCAERYGLPLIASRGELPILERAASASLMWGVPYRESPLPAQFIAEGDLLPLGAMQWTVLDVPGHSPGHIALVHHGTGTILSGDVLFKGSIGRTDLPMCDHAQLLRSIGEKMYTLPDHYMVYSGHGPATTIGVEKRINPFVRG